jgi:hypothetical protein
MSGTVGFANMFGTPEEAEGSVLQLPALRYGENPLSKVSVASFSPGLFQKFKERAGTETIGILGGDAFRNYRVGVDYAHSTVYLDRVGRIASSDMSVVGVTLRPEPDGRYTVVAIVEFDGKPSVTNVKTGDVLLGIDGAPVTGATMGQVWSLLGGSLGQTRSLMLEREGKRFTVNASVHHFLAAQGGKGHPGNSTGKWPNKK